jgi:hypothetical protein
MHDTRLEERLRQALRSEGDALHLTVTADRLKTRLRLRRAERANRRLALVTAAALVVAVGAGGGFLLANRGTTPPVAASSSPAPSAPAQTPTASPSASPAVSLAPVGDIDPYPGWETFGRLNGPDGDAQATVTGELPQGGGHLLVSTACQGTGTVTITATVDDTWTVDCPATSARPYRMMPYLGDATKFEVRVTTSGSVAYQVLVEGSDVPLDIPPVVLRHGADQATMAWGCGGSISLGWGYDAGDSCATTLPSTPLETLELATGDVATVTIDGWTVTDARATCGRITTAPDAPSLFEVMTECTVTAVLKGSTVSVSGLPKEANAWVVELNLTARNAVGDGFSGPFYAYIFVR